MKDFSTLQVENDQDGVCWIKFNRPQKYNAVSFRVSMEIFY